ncbi:MAG: hypothetical protein HQ582_19915, partial [Planctomycetes bacterium]|nr:hypothetical protein [Planctomycetota bacterium]
MFGYRFNKRTVKLAKTLVLTAAAGLVVFGFAPAPAEKATPPVFTNPQPAKNPTGLSLTVDPQKVLGWISGTGDYSGQAVRISAGDRDETVIVQDDNTFTWHYRVDEPVTATFTVGQWTVAELLEPIEPDRPAVFFVVDRTAYRPNQKLEFAGFLRQPDRRGEFHPIAGREVEVTLTSKRKKTTAAKLKPKSDDFGRITGDYTFSAADALDTYTLSVDGFAGKAEVALAEFRKAKVRLKIDGVPDGNRLKLEFQAVDFLDKPVPGTNVHFTTQVVADRSADRKLPLKAEQFAYHEASPWGPHDAEGLSEDEQLLWEAGIPTAAARPRGGATVLAQHEGDLALDKSGHGEHTLTLDDEWFRGGHCVLVGAVLVDYNGREQRAARRIPLGSRASAEKAGRVELVLPKRQYAGGEAIQVRVSTHNVKAPPAATALVAMKLSPAAPTAPIGYPYLQNNFNSMGGMYGGWPYRSAAPRWTWPGLRASRADFHGAA